MLLVITKCSVKDVGKERVQTKSVLFSRLLITENSLYI